MKEKKAVPATHSPTINDLYWAAGFIEGEGHPFVKWGMQKGKQYFTPCLTANQVEMEPIDKLQRMFGGIIRHEKRSAKNPNWNDINIWYCHGARALGIMQTLYPLLSPKRQAQIRTVLDKFRVTSIT